jgi:hypothetical protein
MLNRSVAGCIVGACLVCIPAAKADIIFQTNDPFGGFLGLNGFDVSDAQSVAARFIPATDYTLDQIQIWFMSNNFEGNIPQAVTVTLRTDTDPEGEFVSVPSEEILETWTLNLDVHSWDPILQDFNSQTHPALHAGARYWIVAESPVAAGQSPVWCWSSSGNEFTATNMGSWQSGSGAAIGVVVNGTPACQADFNHDGTLDFFDYLDFVDAFAASNTSADYNGDSIVDFFDYLDFVNDFSAGC